MHQEPPKTHDLASLNSLYQESDSVDQDIFAEMRSNVLLVAGDHYARKNSKIWSRIRDSKQLSDEQKIRLTKNHIQKIVKTYVNNIISYAPGVAILPKSENERQDQKAAELNNAVWQDAKEHLDYDESVLDWCDDFVGIGEVGTKVFWDPQAGPIVAYNQKTTKAGENLYLDAQGGVTKDPGLNEMGQPTHEAAPGEPVFRGMLTKEDFYGFNLLRPVECKSLRKAEWLGLRKMVAKHVVMSWVGHDEDKMKMIQSDQDKTYLVFDAASGGYGNTVNQVLIKEFYFRPCHKYPKGYYYIFTEHGILFEGELPFEIFPIVVGQFDKIQTTPRGRSIVKVLRPYQIEINRAASKMAEHQITLGDDKILIQKGTELSQGGVLPGIRGVTYSGKEPQILNGRDGSQYLNYHNAKVEEMYAVAMVAEDSQENQGTQDPYAMLFKAASQRKKFTRYTKRFERYLIEFCKVYLSLAKKYYTDDMLVPAIGRREYINIDEFRNSEDLCYQIKLEAQNDDIETKFGKMMSINHTIQYVGSKLDKEDIGKLLRANPYANEEESFSDFTIDYDTSTNMILALDRGATPKISRHGKKEYIVKRLNKRMQEADFDFLSPQIQATYEQTLAQYESMIAEEAEAMRAAQAGFIPTDGYMVTVDLYVSDATNPYKTKRARIPYSSLTWLIKAIERQGLSQEALAGIEDASKASIGRQLTGANPGAGANGVVNFPDRRGPIRPQGEMSNGYGTITQPVQPSQ